ncbi:MAG: hypothetical protein ACUVRY_02940 [Thermoanaerobaculaceae bacterium]
MRRRRSVADYFLAVLGAGFLLFLLGIILTPGSCKFQVDPDADKAFVNPTPTLQ